MAKGKEWLARATGQFARTVYAELRRAGHGKNDIVRFIGELMDVMSNDAQAEVAAPALVDPQAGLPDGDTLHDIIDFELRIRRKDRRQDERLVIVAIDVLIPSWVEGTRCKRTHELIAAAIGREQRVGDSHGQLGPDRYLLVLPRAKEAVRSSIEMRLTRALGEVAGELAASTRLELRWAAATDSATAITLLEQCFAATPEVLAPASAQPASPPRPTRARPTSPGDLVLALGGGAARAVSHAGMLHVLDAAGIRTVALAGCSAGALVGAMFARGITPDAIASRFVELPTTALYREMRAAYARFLRESRGIPRSRLRYFGASNLAFYSDTALSIMTNDHLLAFVEYFVGSDCDLATLHKPLAVVATDLVEGRPVKLSHGSLHDALAASCAVPGLFPPQRLGERLLVDGGNVTEVPIWAAHLFGHAAPTLAVYMARPFHRITDYRTSTEVSARSNALIHAELVREQLGRADLLLTIPIEEVGWLDFRRAPRIVEIGRRATEDALPRIRERLQRDQR